MLFSFAHQHPSKSRIAFFMNFIQSFGKPEGEVMKKCKMPETFLNHVRHSDNLRISVLFKICKSLGYSCLIFLEPQNPPEAQLYRERAFRTRYNGSHGKNLDFLKDFCEIEGIRNPELGKRLGFSRARVSGWLRTDDLDLRRVYAICKAYNRNFHVIIQPLSTQNDDSHHNDDECKVIYDLNHHHCYPFGDEFSSGRKRNK